MTALAALPVERTPRVYQAAVVIVDIEGTISPISYVKNVLFPYAAARLRGYVIARRLEPGVSAVLEEARQLIGGGDPIVALETWQANDVKAKPLKTLQGWIWAEGYAEGAFASPLFPDALEALRRWRTAGVPLYVYSSGSVAAQELFFRHTMVGDLSSLFAGHFDTSIGAKTEFESYLAIASDIGVAPGAILCLSDNPFEIAAAYIAGFQVGHVAKEALVDPRWPTIHDFGQVELVRRR